MSPENQNEWQIRIDDETYTVDDPVLTGQQLLQLAGRIPAEEHVVLFLGDQRQLEDIDLEESVDLRSPGRERFLTFRSDRLFNFELDGQRQSWGAASITEPALRKIAGIGGRDRVWQERRDEEDLLLEDGQEVPLDTEGLERFYTDRKITIVVNGREKTVEGPSITYDQLLALAFDPVPTGEFICFSVSYRRGGGDNPKGMLDEGETVSVRNGMVFNVTYTDKS